MNEGPQGTTRVDAGPDVGSGGTIRVTVPVAGPEGTTRVAAGPEGTTRVGSPVDTTIGGPAAPAPVADSSQFASGSTVSLNGSYRIISELGVKSSEAITYLVERGAEKFVLKRYHKGIQMPRDVLAQIKAAPHPNVVRIHDFGEIDGQDVEILEFLAAGSLDQLLRGSAGVRDPGRLRKLTRAILAGLQHLHSTVRVIYQDLKPQNILLGNDTFDKVVLADFGISSLMKPGEIEAVVKANGTKEYAAPELATFGHQTDTPVDPKVDYFAFGVTLLECWTGARPFDGIPDALRIRQIRSKEVQFPPGIDPQLEVLIKGLLNPLPKERWGRDEIARWIDGKALTVEYSAQHRKYGLRWFSDQESFSSPPELAVLLTQYPTKGVDYLFLGRIQEWLDQAGDMELSTEIMKITRNFAQDDSHRRAGLIRATYVLDPSRPFETAGGTQCRTAEEFGDALLAEKAHYVQALSNPLDPFHLYLQSTGENDTSTTILAYYLSAETPEFAFNTAVYALQSGGRDRLKLGGKYYFTPADINSDPPAQAALRTQLATGNSLGLMWLQKLGVVAKLNRLADADPVDALSLLNAFPWLSVKGDAPELEQRQGKVANGLIGQGRMDLLAVYLARGLIFDTGSEATPPLQYAAALGNEAAVRFLIEHGATVDYGDKVGTTALDRAIMFRQEAVARLLLEKGANPNSRNQDGLTPLSAAATRWTIGDKLYPVSPALLGIVLEAGAKPDQPGLDGALPLHAALYGIDSGPVMLEVLDRFLKRGASAKLRGKDETYARPDGHSALFAALFAYKFSHKQSQSLLPVVTRLVDAGANPNEFHDGKTPLHYAATWGDEALCKTLLAAGAKRTSVSRDDLMPATIARASNFQNLGKLLDPGFAFRFRGRVAAFLGGLVKTLVLALVIAAVAPLASIAHTPEGPQPTTLAAVYAALLVAIALGGLGLAGSVQGFRARLGKDVKRITAWFWYLIVLPPLLLGLSYVESTALGSPPRRYLYGDSQTNAWLPVLVAYAVLGLVVFGSLQVSKRVERARATVRKLDGLKATVPSRLSRFSFRVPRLVRWIAYGSLLYFGLPYLYKTYQEHQQQQQNKQAQTYAQARFDYALLHDSCGVGEFLRTGMGTIVPNAQLSSKSNLKTWPVDGRNQRVPSSAKLCRITVEGQQVAVIADPAFNSEVRKIGHRVPVPVSVPLRDIEPLNVARHIPEQAPSPTEPNRPAPMAPVPAPVPPLAGVVTSLSPEGWPIVNGQTVHLTGIGSLAPAERARFQSWLASKQNYMDCKDGGSGTYQCFARGGSDIALVLLANGAASASPTAQQEYKNAMTKAMQAKRGQWK